MCSSPLSPVPPSWQKWRLHSMASLQLGGRQLAFPWALLIPSPGKGRTILHYIIVSELPCEAPPSEGWEKWGADSHCFAVAAWGTEAPLTPGE